MSQSDIRVPQCNFNSIQPKLTGQVPIHRLKIPIRGLRFIGKASSIIFSDLQGSLYLTSIHALNGKPLKFKPYKASLSQLAYNEVTGALAAFDSRGMLKLYKIFQNKIIKQVRQLEIVENGWDICNCVIQCIQSKNQFCFTVEDTLYILHGSSLKLICSIKQKYRFFSADIIYSTQLDLLFLADEDRKVNFYRNPCKEGQIEQAFSVEIQQYKPQILTTMSYSDSNNVLYTAYPLNSIGCYKVLKDGCQRLKIISLSDLFQVPKRITLIENDHSLLIATADDQLLKYDIQKKRSYQLSTDVYGVNTFIFNEYQRFILLGTVNGNISVFKY